MEGNFKIQEQYFHLTILASLLFIVYLIYSNKCSCSKQPEQIEHFEISSINTNVSQDSNKLCSEAALNNGIFNYNVNKINRGNRAI
jgi:Tol biopolymer transport system component